MVRPSNIRCGIKSASYQVFERNDYEKPVETDRKDGSEKMKFVEALNEVVWHKILRTQTPKERTVAWIRWFGNG